MEKDGNHEESIVRQHLLHLQRKGERQIRLHRATGWQHNLVGPQDLLGALRGKQREK